MAPFAKALDWRRLQCSSRHTFGFASADASGTLEVRCTAKNCKRHGYKTVHLFNLATGQHVTECVPISEQTNQSDSGSA